MTQKNNKMTEYRYWYHYLRRDEKVSNAPLYMNIEPTSACNINCTICSLDGSRKRGFIDMDFFYRVVDEAKELGVERIALFLAGEPLLHKNIAEMVDYVVKSGIEARIRTNAVLLTPEKSEALLKAGLDFLGISFDGDNKEEYESIRVGADYEQTLENVLNFLRLKKEMGLERPFVSLQMIKLFENPNQQIDPEFKKLFEGLPLDEFSLISPHSWRGEKDDVGKRDWGKYYYPCTGLWSAFSVAWDGKVICCTDLNGRQVFGDLNKQTIMEVWNGEQMRHHRRLMKEGRISDLPLCANCHAAWFNHRPRLFALSHLPPFDQIKGLYRRIR